MWSGPRNISTTMMRSFSSRSDTIVTDEPFYACYLERTGLQHPGREEILRSCNRDYNSIINDITSPVPAGKTVWYQKHMAHHLEPDISLSWTKDLMNCLLIRTPAEVISSFSKKNELTDINELGYLSKSNYTGIIKINCQWLMLRIYCKIRAVYSVTFAHDAVFPLKKQCYHGQLVPTLRMVFGANTGTINYGPQLLSNPMYKKR